MRNFGASIIGVALVGLGSPVMASTPPVPDPQPSFELWAVSQGQSLSAVSCTTDATTATCYGRSAEGSAFGASATIPDLAWTAMPSPGAAAAVTTAAAVPTTAAAPAAGDNDHVFASGEISIPAGEPGQVSVAATAPSDGSSVPMIVRNDTANVVSNVSVTGTARDAAGTLTATGASQGFMPEVLEPGDWSMGYVYFDFDALAGGETFEFSVSYDDGPADSFIGRINLVIVEATLQGDRVVGIVRNDSSEAGSLAQVYVGCFVGGTFANVESGFADGDEVPAGGTSSFSVDIFDSCEVFAAAGGAWAL